MYNSDQLFEIKLNLTMAPLSQVNPFFNIKSDNKSEQITLQNR